MDPPEQSLSYPALVALADTLLEESDDDLDLLVHALDQLPSPVRDELLVSDLLNAYQVFYYFYRLSPGPVESERMILLPASELVQGIRICEIELLELIFVVDGNEPIMMVGDGERVLTTFTGKNAYRDAAEYCLSAL